MSRSSRKHSSKWDLPEEPQFVDANMPDDGWMGKPSRPFHHTESGREWLSSEVAGSNASKWSGLETNDMQRSKRSVGLSSREPLTGSRGSHRNENISKPHRNENISKGSSRYPEESMAWDGEENSARMSPGLDEWKVHRSRSPKSGWSRSLRGRSRSRSWTRSRSHSWSRSPDRGYRRESVFLDRNRSRSGVSVQVCKDFSGGRCRRGSDCQLLHEGTSSYDDSWEGRHRKGSASKYSSPLVTGDNPLKSGRSSLYGNDFVNGKSRREASSKFDNHRVSDGFSKGSANEIVSERDNERERDIDRRRRNASTERGAEPEPRRSSDIPCKFFAAGNCRNKTGCRFSHHIQSHVSSERRSRGDRWGPGHNLNDPGQTWDVPKWNDTVTSDSAKLSPDNTGRSRDVRWPPGPNINDTDQAWDGPKWSDTVPSSESAKLSADNNVNIGVPETRSNARSMNDTRWGHGLVNENQMRSDPNVRHEAANRNEKEVHLWKEGNVGASKSKDNEKWLGDMSPDWNYRLQSSNFGKEEHGHVTQGSESLRFNDTSLNACKQDMSPNWNYTLKSSNNIGREEHGHIVRGSESSRLNDTSLKACNIGREASGQVHGAAQVMQPMIADRSNYPWNQDMREGGSTGLPHDGEKKFDHGVQSSMAFDNSGMTTIGESQMHTPTQTQGLVNSQDALSAQRTSVINLDITDSKTSLLTALPPVPDAVVGGKDLSQLNSLSASLAQFLENGHQLPQLYAALNSHNASNAPTLSKSEGSSEQLSAIVPDPAMSSQKPYDPVCDRGELKKQEIGSNTGNTGVDRKLEKSSDGHHQTSKLVEEPKRKSHQLRQPDCGAKSEVVNGNNELDLEEMKKIEDDNNSPENGPLEVLEKDGADEGKKPKEVKGIRAFKFALAEFVKELLKPTWKDGQVSKDAYKTIVKKVVDKVTGTILGANIPQTQEKIDSYLSFSKPKLTKLVQAYVEKMQKG